jgi:hypothetical protein
MIKTFEEYEFPLENIKKLYSFEKIKKLSTEISRFYKDFY